MKLFEEICDRYQKLSACVELDLRYALKHNSRKREWDEDYYADLRKILKEECLIEFIPYKFIITDKGRKVLRRGWVVKRIILLVLPTIKDLLFRLFC